MKPFLSYVGSKQKWMNKIKEFFPEEINNYHEPFVGGGSIFFYINQHYQINKNYINDMDDDLINTYKIIKKYPEELINELTKLNKLKNKKQFEEMVNLFNENKKNKILLAAIYIFLNKRSFNARFNYTQTRKTIKPNYADSFKNKNIFDGNNINDINKLLKQTKICSMDYKKFLEKVVPGENDFVFLDPPYLVSNSCYFYKNIFKLDDYKELKKTCDELNKNKVKFMITLNKHKELKKIFIDYNIKCIKKHSRISQGLGNEYEMIITNYKS